MKTKDENENIHADHRKRLQKLIFSSDLKSLSNIQILEYILTLAIPRIDTNPISHRLLKEFGSISSVLEADYNHLIKVKGIGPRTAMTIKSLCKIFHFYLEGDSDEDKTVLKKPNEIVFHFRKFFQKKQNEEFYIACLNAKNQLIKCEQISTGSVNSVAIDLRAITDFVNKSNASLVILAHNHPEGSSAPSGEDMQATEKIYEILSILNIGLVDHIIISEKDYFSFHAAGLLDRIRENHLNRENSFSNKLLPFVADCGRISYEKSIEEFNSLTYPSGKFGS